MAYLHLLYTHLIGLVIILTFARSSHPVNNERDQSQTQLLTTVYLPIIQKPIPPGNFSISLLTQIGGANNVVVVDGDKAYLGIGARLVILDVSDPSNPKLLGQSSLLLDQIRDIQVTDKWAYLAAGRDGGLTIMDISDPTNPKMVSNYFTSGVAEEVSVVNNIAYVAAANAGIQIIDVSDPLNLRLVGSYATSDLAVGISVIGDKSYVADYYGGFLILDISDPTNPIPLGSYATTAAVSVSIIDHTAFVVDAISGLYILDVNVSEAPTLISHYAATYPAGYEFTYSVEVLDNRVYLADSNDGLRILDISQPESPYLLGIYEGTTKSIAATRDVVYMADTNIGLRIIDVRDPNFLNLLGVFNSSPIQDVSVLGNLAYLASNDGLLIYDLSNPSIPTIIGTHNTPGPGRGVAVSGNFAYVIFSLKPKDIYNPFRGGLQIVDIQNPDFPILLGNYDFESLPMDISVKGNLVYITHRGWSGGGLKIINGSDPYNPSLLGSYDSILNSQRSQIVENFGYIAAWDNGLVILDLSDPTEPSLVGSYKTPYYARDVSVEGYTAYVSDYYDGIHIVNVSNPTTPQYINNYDEDYGLLYEGILVSGGLAYQVSPGSVKIIDVSDPESPNLRASYPIPGNYSSSGDLRDLVIVGSKLFVVSQSEGLLILNVASP